MLALADLRAEAGEAVLPLLAQPHYPHAELALEVLTWSSHPRIAPLLREWVLERVPMVRRAQQPPPGRAAAPAAPSPPTCLIAPSCDAARPSLAADRGVSAAGRSRLGPDLRLSAVGSLGWWEPLAAA